MLALVAIAGSASGLAVSARRASACSCVPPDIWSVVLESATSSDPNVDHSALWPLHGYVYEEPRQVTLSGKVTDAGVVWSVKVAK